MCIVTYSVVSILNLLISTCVNILATVAVLNWSSKWSKYDDSAFRDLGKYMHRNIDPNYPAAETKESISIGTKNSTTG